MPAHGDGPLADSGKPLRFEGIDVARGAAMLLVFLAHYLADVTVQVPDAAQDPLIHLLDMLTYAAAPAFVFISGFTLAAVLARTAPGDLKARKLVALDRAAFMLVVGHLLLSTTEVLLAGTPPPWNQMFITDVIALSIMLGLLVLPGWPPSRVVGLAVASFVAGWWLNLNVPHHGRGVTALAWDILFWLDGAGALSFGYPLLQWFSWFLVGALLGGAYARIDSPERRRAWGRRLVVAATAIISLSVMARLALKLEPMAGWLSPGLHGMIMLGARTPPGPVHLGVFGALGVLLTGVALQLPDADSGPGRAIAVLGRTSLFVFFLQSLIFRDIVARLPLGARWTWPVVFALSVVVIWIAARYWDSIEGNRWFRLGLAPRPRVRT